ncbi:MAG: hypothetical protein HKN20_09145 [Gemmatimonadetes bacterium]|nr:hypothetical protein [Gemmatimonadota bacterium]
MKTLLIIGAIAGAGSIVVADTTSFPSYETEVSRLDAEIAAIEERLQTAPRSSLDHEKASIAFEERARLTGGFADYASAESLLVRAFELAPAGAGPFLTRATLHYTMHRFDEVEADLAIFETKLLLNTRERAAIAGLRGDVAMQAGDFSKAEAFYRESIRLRKDMKSLARLAMLRSRMEQWDEAELLYRQASLAYHGARAYPKAWLLLQRARNARHRGDIESALSLCDAADRAFPGWWITDVERAEVLVARGDVREGMTLLRAATAERERPELERRLAALCRQLADEGASQDYDRQARKHERRAAMIDLQWAAVFPETVHAHGANGHAHGHAHEHAHSHGPHAGHSGHSGHTH